jgi:uncharacterized protein
MANTIVAGHDLLPLTCTRAGTCCHGKDVRINPWELACLAQEQGVPALHLRDHRLRDGTRLRFDGPQGALGSACTFYDATSTGCTVHGGRPLACRLYPLGRRLSGAQVDYLHEGRQFPCLTGCPQVLALPRQRVDDYLAQQGAAVGETVQDAYRALVADLAEGAFVLLFDSGLARSSGEPQRTLRAWQRLHTMEQRQAAIGDAWFDRLTVPTVELPLSTGTAWVADHHRQLQHACQQAFATLNTADALREASIRMLAMALTVADGIGADQWQLLATWLERARK